MVSFACQESPMKFQHILLSFNLLSQFSLSHWSQIFIFGYRRGVEKNTYLNTADSSLNKKPNSLVLLVFTLLTDLCTLLHDTYTELLKCPCNFSQRISHDFRHSTIAGSRQLHRKSYKGTFWQQEIEKLILDLQKKCARASGEKISLEENCDRHISHA